MVPRCLALGTLAAGAASAIGRAPPAAARSSRPVWRRSSMTTMRDVARVAGVSAKTVSTGLQRRSPRHRGDPRAGPLGDAESSTTSPTCWPAASARARTRRSAWPSPTSATRSSAEITSSIEIDLVGRGMAVVVSSLGQAAERERSALEALLRRQISGLIVACASADQAYLSPLAGPDAAGVRGPAPEGALRRVRDRGRSGRRPRGGHASRQSRSPPGGLPGHPPPPSRPCAAGSRATARPWPSWDCSTVPT